jgi:hypothetical protein
VAGNVSQQQTGDAAGAATGGIVNVATALSLTVWFAVDPRVEAAEFNATRGELAASPHFHALHLLGWLLVHR